MSLSSPNLNAISSEIAALAAAAGQSVVSVAHKRTVASGFFWRPDIVVTACEAIAASPGESVGIEGEGGARMTGTIVARDPGTDVALVRVGGSGHAVPAAGSSPLALGQAVVVAGRTPYGAIATLGHVMLAGDAWRSMHGGELSQRVWIDARMSRASEGSAVLDSSGNFAGMAVLGPRRRVVLIPASTIERVGGELLAHGRIRHGYLGVSVQAVSLAAIAGGTSGIGLMVMGLDDAGPAGAAGILRGDIITAIDGQTPKSPRSLVRMLPGSTIGAQKSIQLVRAGQPTQISVVIGDRPAT